MSISLENTITNMYALMRKGIKYSMNGCRTGRTCMTGDCSGTIYDSLRLSGASNAGWILNTDYMHDWLINNGFNLIAQNKSWQMKRGDIVILGQKWASSGAFGHVFIAVDNRKAIHCNYSANGVSVDYESIMPYSMGFYVYRLNQVNKPITPNNTGGNKVDYSKRAVISYVNEADLDGILPLIKFLTPSYIVDVVKSGQADFSGYQKSNWRIGVGGKVSNHSGYINYHISGKNREDTAAKILDFRNNSNNRKNYLIKK